MLSISFELNILQNLKLRSSQVRHKKEAGKEEENLSHSFEHPRKYAISFIYNNRYKIAIKTCEECFIHKFYYSTFPSCDRARYTRYRIGRCHIMQEWTFQGQPFTRNEKVIWPQKCLSWIARENKYGGEAHTFLRERVGKIK